MGLHLPMQRVCVRSLVGELICRMPPGQKTKAQIRNNTVTNSVKTLKNGFKKMKFNAPYLKCQINKELNELTGQQQ